MDAVSRLREIPFLSHLTPEEFEALAEMMDLRAFTAGDKILTQGEPTTNFYIVDSGHVNLRHTSTGGLERPIGSKGVGDFFGVKMFTTQEPSEYTFEAVATAEMWVVERRDWDELQKKFPDVLTHMPELRAEYERLTGGLEWLAPGEVIDVTTRKHWWALVLMIRLPLIVAVVFTVALLISYAFGVTQTLPQVWLVYLVVMTLLTLWMIWNGLNWYNDLYIVTNKRVVRIIKVLFISDSRQDLPIEKIQSQRVERGGPISVFLNISDLRITSAASEGTAFVFEQVGDVARIQRAIEGERAHLSERKAAAEREAIRRQITGEIKHYVFEQPPVPEPTATKTPPPATKPTARSAVLNTQLTRFWRPRPTKIKKVPKPPVPLGKRLRAMLQALAGTEIRQGSVVTWRKHRIVLLDQITTPLIALVALIALTAVLSWGGVSQDLLNSGVYFALGFLILVAIGFVAWEWEDWRRDLYRLSDTEIVDIESLPFGLHSKEQKAELKNIQDVTNARPGLINTMLDFGNVDVRVAGSAAPFTFTSISHPKQVADEIADRIEAIKLRSADRATREQTRGIVDAIIAYHRLMMAERHQNAPVPAPTILVTPAAPAPEVPSSPPPAPTVDAEGEFPPEADLRA